MAVDYLLEDPVQVVELAQGDEAAEVLGCDGVVDVVVDGVAGEGGAHAAEPGHLLGYRERSLESVVGARVALQVGSCPGLLLLERQVAVLVVGAGALADGGEVDGLHQGPRCACGQRRRVVREGQGRRRGAHQWSSSRVALLPRDSRRILLRGPFRGEARGMAIGRALASSLLCCLVESLARLADCAIQSTIGAALWLAVKLENLRRQHLERGLRNLQALLRRLRLEVEEEPVEAPRHRAWNRTPAHLERRVVRLHLEQPLLGAGQLRYLAARVLGFTAARETFRQILLRNRHLVVELRQESRRRRRRVGVKRAGELRGLGFGLAWVLGLFLTWVLGVTGEGGRLLAFAARAGDAPADVFFAAPRPLRGLGLVGYFDALLRWYRFGR
ncbi:MAG: hypothetical protein ACYC8T_24550 [Myxococcaceae bacterium]